MSCWNYRVLAFMQKNDTIFFELHTVYYEEPDGKADGYGAPVVGLTGTTKKSLRWELNAMKKALEKPILWGDESKFPKEYKKLKKKSLKHLF